MCEPTMMMAGASLAIGAAQAQVSNNAKQADYAAKSAAWTQNVVNARAAAVDEGKAIITHGLEESDKLVQKRHLSYMEQAQKSALVEVSATAGGVGGASIDNLLDGIAATSEQNRTYQDENYAYVAADEQLKLRSVDTRAQGRINSVARPVEPADTRLLDIASSGVKAFGMTQGKGA